MHLFGLYHLRWFHGLILLLAGVVITALSACQTTLPPTEPDQSSPIIEATAIPRPLNTPTVAVTPTLTATATITDDGTITLTFWTVEAISPKAEGELGTFFSNSLSIFERNTPHIKVKVVLKKASGKGGVLDFLRTARETAPSILPDVAIMNAADLNQAYADGILQTLDDRLDRPIVQDLLPAARRMGTVNERLVGAPLALDIEHTIYNTRTFTTTPLLWSDVLSNGKRYLFPAKGVNGLVNDVTISQYFSAGGNFRSDQGNPQIDDRVLRAVLGFYQQGLAQKVIDPANLEAASTADTWPIYLAGKASLTQVSVRQYLADRASLKDTAFAALPVQEAKNTPIVITHGSALVLITKDINRQRAALRLIEWFLSTSNNATWNSLNKSIPTRGTAFQQLAGDDPYWAFLTEQLNTAQPEPGFVGYDQLRRIIQQAVEQVIRGEATAEEATATVMDALTP